MVAAKFPKPFPVKRMLSSLALAVLAGLSLVGLILGMYERAVLVDETNSEGRVHLVELAGIASSMLLVFVGVGGVLHAARAGR